MNHTKKIAVQGEVIETVKFLPLAMISKLKSKSNTLKVTKQSTMVVAKEKVVQKVIHSPPTMNSTQ